MDYQAEAQPTKSNQFHGELVSKQFFINKMLECILTLQALDKVKKALFYGRAEPAMLVGSQASCDSLGMLNLAENKQDQIDILHGIVGKATEAGELLEALFDSIIYNKPFDKVNCVEEIGDGLWYDAITLNAVGGTFEAAQVININKLRLRYPNKFTEYDATNRDLVAERKILEGKPDYSDPAYDI